MQMRDNIRSDLIYFGGPSDLLRVWRDPRFCRRGVIAVPSQARIGSGEGLTLEAGRGGASRCRVVDIGLYRDSDWNQLVVAEICTSFCARNGARYYHLY